MAERTLAGVNQPVPTEGYFDVLQMLTGVGLILFMWGHMILVASVNLGSGVMNAIAVFLEDTYLTQVGGLLIVFVFLLHFVLTARKIPFRSREQFIMGRHSLRLNHGDTWLWVAQVVTGMIILIMGCIHMWNALTTLPITAAGSAARIQGGWWLAFYLILLPIVELHVGLGFYRVGVKWGWITRANRNFFKTIERKQIWAFMIVGLVTLFTFYFIISAAQM